MLEITKGTKHSLGSCLACPADDKNYDVYEISGNQSTFRICQRHMKMLNKWFGELKAESTYINRVITEEE